MPRRDEIVRQCCLTREHRPAAELVRFVVGPDGVLVPDVDARAQGRGVWVTLSAEKVAEAVRRKAFARSLGGPVEVPEALAELTRERLEQRLVGALGLARKAGQLVTGATRVRSSLQRGEAMALITARDAAPDSRAKMLGALGSFERTAQAAGDVGYTIPHFDLLDSRQLSLAVGLENVIHAALTTGAAAQSALARAERLARYVGARRDSERDAKLHG